MPAPKRMEGKGEGAAGGAAGVQGPSCVGSVSGGGVRGRTEPRHRRPPPTHPYAPAPRRYTEFYRPVIDEVDAVSLGSLYGSLLRMMAVGQGWLQEEDEEEAAAAGEEEE